MINDSTHLRDFIGVFRIVLVRNQFQVESRRLVDQEQLQLNINRFISAVLLRAGDVGSTFQRTNYVVKPLLTLFCDRSLLLIRQFYGLWRRSFLSRFCRLCDATTRLRTITLRAKAEFSHELVFDSREFCNVVT